MSELTEHVHVCDDCGGAWQCNQLGCEPQKELGGLIQIVREAECDACRRVAAGGVR